ncbi:MAG: UPF0182 family protein [Mogibacterium sp.]|nr:UPF0182 family protein [Mogibacterium sp.]
MHFAGRNITLAEFTDGKRPKRQKRQRQVDPEERARRRRGRKGLSLAIMLIALVLAFMVMFVGFITDWMWFADLGYTSVFWKRLLTQLELGVPVFVVVTLLARFYLRALKNGYFKKIESHEIPNLKKVNSTSWILSIVFGLGIGLYTSTGTWLTFLKSKYSTDFGLKDPLFNLDIGFYIFNLDWLDKVNEIILVSVIGLVVVTVVYYSYLLSVRSPDLFDHEEDLPPEPEFEEEEEDEEPKVIYRTPIDHSVIGRMGRAGKKAVEAAFDPNRKKKRGHRTDINDSNVENLMNIASGKLIILGVIFYLMLAVDFFLKQFDLLHTHTGAVYGAGFVDVNVTLWVYRIIMLLCFIGAVTLAIHIKKGEITKLLKMPVIMVLVFALGFGAASLVQSLIVSPDEINKESKYLQNNIEYTRHAYGIDDVRVANFSADDSLNANVINDNDETIGNIRINDYVPVEDFYNQTQSIRQYYRFNDVDIDRYNINGSITQTYLSAREIDEEKISNTWINKHLKYTHGYGAAVSMVDTVTASGQPDVIEGNIPPETNVAELKIDRPEIYFSELSKDYIIVNTKEAEFDYPDGSENKYTEYEGKTGIKLNLFNRILFAIKEGNVNILVSSNITSKSKIMYNRSVVSRVEKIMPYLAYEEDPYMTIVDGKLYWILDAYTISSKYPYSEPYDSDPNAINPTNYIRNSIKVVVDAYDGSTNFYIVDEEDPIARTYQKIYPKLFKSYNEISDELKPHLRYPNAMFKIQAYVYSKYHMDEVKVFYQKEDLWDIAHQIYGTEDVEMDPSYYVFNLPDTKEGAEFINMVPFTPKSKQNMTAIMMGRNDGDNYGQLIVYTMPKNKTIYGPMQIEAQIDQNTEISKEFSLWKQSGSTYKRGDLFVIPIGTSLLYVEPVYLEATNQAIPEVKRVIVAYQDKIAYEATLGEALMSLFGGDAGDSGSKIDGLDDGGTDEDLKSLIKKAQNAYDKAIECQKEGDWEGYGKYIGQLESYLTKLVNESGTSAPAAAPAEEPAQEEATDEAA